MSSLPMKHKPKIYVESGERVVTAHKNERASYDQRRHTSVPDSRASRQPAKAAQKSHAARFHCDTPRVRTPSALSPSPTLAILLSVLLHLENRRASSPAWSRTNRSEEPISRPSWLKRTEDYSSAGATRSCPCIRSTKTRPSRS